MRLIVDLLRGAHLDDAAHVEHAHLVTHGHGFNLVVGHVQEGGAKFHLQVFQLGAQDLAQFRVEVRQRFVHQEHPRLAHDRPADGDALHLAAREPVGLALQQMLDAQGLCGLGNARIDLLPRHAPDLRLERKFQVLPDRVMRIQRVVLEHQRHVALRRAPVQRVRPVDRDAAAIRAVESGDQPQRSGLARAGRPQQHEELAVADFQVELAQRRVAAEFLGYVFESDVGHSAYSRMCSDSPVRVLKKCVCASSSFAHTTSPALAT